VRKTPSRTCLWQRFRHVGGAKARVVECSEGEDSNAGFSQAACAAQCHPRGTRPLPDFHAYLVPKNEQTSPVGLAGQGTLKCEGIGQKTGSQTAWKGRRFSVEYLVLGGEASQLAWQGSVLSLGQFRRGESQEIIAISRGGFRTTLRLRRFGDHRGIRGMLQPIQQRRPVACFLVLVDYSRGLEFGRRERDLQVEPGPYAQRI